MKYLNLFLLLWMFANCNGQKATTSEPATGQARSFQMVAIPEVLVTPEERADYLVQHYWDRFDFSDTAYIHLPEVTEQAFVDYIDILPYTSLPLASQSILAMLKKAEAKENVYAYFADLYEKYLYDASSPVRNEEFYIPVLEAMLASPAVTEKVRPAYLLELAKRNRTGEKATDFVYTQADGNKASLYKLAADYTLLFFYNPECANCREVSRHLQNSPLIQYFLKEGKMKILAIYPDEDLTAWRNYRTQIPSGWINSYDDGMKLKDGEVYDLKAIPTLYLLDKEKKVLLKDVSVEQLTARLSDMIPN